jgi:hypothetical protein
MLLRIATILAGSAALALTVPAAAAPQSSSLPTCSATVTDNCVQKDGTTHRATSHKTTHRSTRHHEARHHKARHHQVAHRKATHHAKRHHAVAHHAATHPASTKTAASGAGTTTTTHTVAPKSGHMVKTSTTSHMAPAKTK